MKIVDIWNYLADSKTLIGKSNAVEGNLPAYCTPVEPPETPAGKVVVFDELNQEWQIADKVQVAAPAIVKVYSYSPNTGIFCSSFNAMVNDIPPYCTTVEPEDSPPAGYVLVFDTETQSWGTEDDFRGTQVWNTGDASAFYITQPGPLPDNVTTLSPGNIPHPTWDGSQWVTDTERQRQAVTRANMENYDTMMQRVMLAQCPLASLEAVDEARMTDEQRQRLADLRTYAVELARFVTTTDLTQPLVFPLPMMDLIHPI